MSGAPLTFILLLRYSTNSSNCPAVFKEEQSSPMYWWKCERVSNVPALSPVITEMMALAERKNGSLMELAITCIASTTNVWYSPLIQ